MKNINTFEKMMRKLETIGLTDEQRKQIRDHYDGDIEGLSMYVLYCIALFDDRHEYI